MLTTPGPIFAIHQALLAGREKALPIWSLHHFMLEILAVVFPAVASMVWPSLSFTLVLSMAFASEKKRLSAEMGSSGGVGQGLRGGGNRPLSRIFLRKISQIGHTAVLACSCLVTAE